MVPPDHFASQRVFDEGGPLRYKALVHPRHGDELVVSVVAAAVRLRAGTPAELVVSVMHDITDSENLERLRDQFFAAAAHALKTPVAIIKANAQLMSRSPRVEHGHATPAHAQAMAAINRQCSRIDRMVQNMLVLSRARSRSLRLYLDEVELAPLVEQIAREMATDERRNDIHAEVAASPRVLADPERLALVLRNVIEEAQRGSVAGTPVTVRVAQDGQDAEVSVAYQALPAEEGLFAAADEYDNLGIGRSVAETIVEAHGGALRAERSGPEATAYIRLPVSMEASP